MLTKKWIRLVILLLLCSMVGAMISACSDDEEGFVYNPPTPETEAETDRGYVEPKIPAEATKIGHSYYMIYSQVCDTWAQAMTYCEELGGHLASITSQAENDAVFAWMLSTGHQTAYFGLSDSVQEGTWTWAGGEPVGYTNWGPGEPNRGPNDDEDYAQFYYTKTDGTWNDGNFGRGTQNDVKVFICEWDMVCIAGDDSYPTHDWAVEEIAIAAGCESEGETRYKCTHCEARKSEQSAALGHAYGAPETVLAASCGQPGLAVRTCERCGLTRDEELPALTHEYSEPYVIRGSIVIPPLVMEESCIHCRDRQTFNSWSYVWVTVLVVAGVVAALIGIINYARAFKKR